MYRSSSSNHKICSPLVVILCVLDIIRCVRNNGIVKVAAVQVVATGGSPFIPGKCKSEKVKVKVAKGGSPFIPGKVEVKLASESSAPSFLEREEVKK